MQQVTMATENLKKTQKNIKNKKKIKKKQHFDQMLKLN